MTSPREIEGWSVSETGATIRANRYTADGIHLMMEDWQGHEMDSLHVPEAVVAELLRARGWTVVEPGAVRIVGGANGGAGTFGPIGVTATTITPGTISRGGAGGSAGNLRTGGAGGDWPGSTLPVPSPESLLAARILAVHKPARQRAARLQTKDAERLVRDVDSAWEGLLWPHDADDLARWTGTVERAERLVKEEG
jgi:hypothetical protein